MNKNNSSDLIFLINIYNSIFKNFDFEKLKSKILQNYDFEEYNSYLDILKKNYSKPEVILEKINYDVEIYNKLIKLRQSNK